MEEVLKPTVAVYDADFIPYYVCHNKKDDPIKTLEDCLNLCDIFIDNINKAVKADYYCGFRTIGKCFRYGINPNYKANRKYPYVDYLKEVQEHLSTHHSFYGQEGYEADDLVMSFKAQYNQFNVIIVSPDKDILGAVNNAYNPRKNEFVNNLPYAIIDNFWKSMITGDSIDGIKGIPGKGESFFNKVIMSSDGMFIKNLPEKIIRANILNEYINHFGEYEGIKEFTKNYLSLKLVDNVELNEVKLNKIEKTVLL